MEDDNPFRGLKRKRLPGMHLITSLEGGVPLQEALAAHFFVMLHDRFQHDCLLISELEKYQEKVKKEIGKARNLDEAALTSIFGLFGNMDLEAEEWSYLDMKHAHIFYLLAGTAVEQVQRWIAEGVKNPYKIPLGQLVERPEWAKKYYDNLNELESVREEKKKARELVEKLKKEIEEPPAPA